MLLSLFHHFGKFSLGSTLIPKPALEDHPICQHVDLSKEFFDFLARHVEQRMFFPGESWPQFSVLGPHGSDSKAFPLA